MNVRLLALALALAGLSTSGPLRAAETDPYYAWRHAPRDSTHAMNRNMNEVLRGAILDLNRSLGGRRLSCPEAARVVSRSFFTTGMWFFTGALRRDGLDFVPRSNTEYRSRYRPVSIYQHSYFAKLAYLFPVDPTLRVGGVNVSPDKIGHFFNDGYDYYKRFHEVLAEGRSEREAHEEAIALGIHDESWIKGDVISGIFSYADLEANEQGFLFYRSLCDGERPALVLHDDGWHLEEPLDFRDWVNPCWDEAFYTSAFDESVGRGVKRALREHYCDLRDDPGVVALLHRYEQRGCTSFSYRYLEALAERGHIPSRRPFGLDAICAEPAPDDAR